MIVLMADETAGVLIKAGRLLAWTSEEGVGELEASCYRCRASLAIDPRDDSIDEKEMPWTRPSATRNLMSASESLKNPLIRWGPEAAEERLGQTDLGRSRHICRNAHAHRRMQVIAGR
jgi:hypothetical protein